MNSVEFEAIDVPVDQVVVSERLRETDSATAQRISVSLLEVGQITPIEVRRVPNGGYQLVAGAHRLEAARMIGLKSIRAIIFGGDEVLAKLREIDENLHRADLSPYDEATFLAARYNLWKAIHEAESHGGDRRSVNWRDQVCQIVKLEKNKLNKRFAAETAEIIGVSERTVYRAIRRRNGLASHWESLRHTDAAQTGVLLDKLLKLGPLAFQDAMEMVSSGNSVEESIAEVNQKRSPKIDPEKILLDAFVKSWRNPLSESHKSARAAVKAWAARQGNRS
ncbi:MAG: hypothetical protein B7Z57_11705 [Acidiphilium sp. 37-60-79]|nr:MAG: hypothetical protein B7Z57_11705 [Acidiphilium sp. 37-60-79]OZB40878.1 MAG: hypothetical protein B7X48_03375 [Acidiphilium sp. 34-60-192]